MNQTPWRLIPVSQETGAFHMAADTYLATMESPRPAVRFYQWQPHALSIGYHQSPDHINFKRCRQQGIDIVRRPTGGRAVFHAQELTYAVILPLDSPFAAGNTQTVHNRISQALADGISRAGISCSLTGDTDNLRTHYKTSPDRNLCFSSQTKHEIQVDGKKLVGSAQRKFPRTILQHGSILTGPEHEMITQFYNLESPVQQAMTTKLKNSTTHLRQELTTPVDAETLFSELTTAFQEHFHCDFDIQDFSDSERNIIEDDASNFQVHSDHEVAYPHI